MKKKKKKKKKKKEKKKKWRDLHLSPACARPFLFRLYRELISHRVRVIIRDQTWLMLFPTYQII